MHGIISKIFFGNFEKVTKMKLILSMTTYIHLKILYTSIEIDSVLMTTLTDYLSYPRNTTNFYKNNFYRNTSMLLVKGCSGIQTVCESHSASKNCHYFVQIAMFENQVYDWYMTKNQYKIVYLTFCVTA